MRFAYLLRPLVFVLFLFTLATSTLALEIPQRTDRYVNDYAGILSSSERERLERSLAEFDRQTSDQIVIVTLPSLEGLSAEEVTLRIAEAWQPGVKGRDNGIVVGIFPNDRQARIEVGYGLEGAIPDALAATILRREMIPHFRRGEWFAGLVAGIEALQRAATGEYVIPRDKARRSGRSWFLLLVLLPIIFILLIVIRLIERARYGAYTPTGYERHRHAWTHWGGGVWPWGGIGGGHGGWGGFSGGGGGFGGGGATGRW